MTNFAALTALAALIPDGVDSHAGIKAHVVRILASRADIAAALRGSAPHSIARIVKCILVTEARKLARASRSSGRGATLSADRAARLSTPATVERPTDGSIALVMSRRAAHAMACPVDDVRPAGGELVSVVVPASKADLLVTGQRLVKVQRRRVVQQASVAA